MCTILYGCIVEKFYIRHVFEAQLMRQGAQPPFAPGDLALQEAARLLFEMEARPSEKALRAQPGFGFVIRDVGPQLDVLENAP